MQSIKAEWIRFIEDLQDRICADLEQVDGHAKFREDRWQRPEGGGGRTRVIANGQVFEKGGVNISTVFGKTTEPMKKQLGIEGESWFACGLSLVIHPQNPFVPTVHANYRMFELYDAAGTLTDCWFGGGTDLTPYYLLEEDVVHFHRAYKGYCDAFGAGLYPQFKQQCDDYFVNHHRHNERRGVGGIFYDHQRAQPGRDEQFWMRFAQTCGYGFSGAYLPIVEKRKDQPFSEQHKHWQEIRRGRYVEFNLVHDRGTIFGLKTNGRTESILMSLPPTVRFEYDDQPEKGSEEEKLLDVCLHPRAWA